MKRKIVLGIMLTLLLIGMLTLAFNIQLAEADQEHQLLLDTDKDIYILRENVKITLTNIGSETEWIGGYPAWTIFTHPGEEPVYPKIFATLLWSLDPGENDTFTWNQYNEYTQSFAEPGMYVIQDTKGWGLSTYFEIKPETTLYVDPSTTTILVDDDFSINVTVAEVTDLLAFSFHLGYNTTILDFVSVWIPPPWETPIIILEPEGYIHVSATSPVSFFGTGVLALISFHATAVGECLLDLRDTILFDSASDFIPHTIIDGSVTMSPGIISPLEALEELIEAIKTSNLPKRTENSLTSRLEGALHLLEKGNENGALHKLMSFIKHVEALRGKKLTNEQADQLIAETQRIIDLIEG